MTATHAAPCPRSLGDAVGVRCPPWVCASLVSQVALPPGDGDDGHWLPGLSPRRRHQTLPGVRQAGRRGWAGSSSLSAAAGTLRGVRNCSEQHSTGCAWHSFCRRIFPAGARRGVADLVAPCWLPRGNALAARDAVQGLVFQLLLPGHYWVGEVELCRCVICCRLGLPGIPSFWDSWLFRSNWMLLRLGITLVQRRTAVTVRLLCAQIKPRGIKAPKPRGVVGCGMRQM